MITVRIVCFAALLAFLSATMHATDVTAKSSHQYAYVGGGCFWCLEAAFEGTEGIVSVVSGYAGGHLAHPSYEDVCTGTTGHAEVVRIEFDPARTSYEKILGLFWEVHDPTTLNRQGPDSGTQYRSIILYSDADQKVQAEKSLAAARKNFSDPIVTEVVPLTEFYEAEAYHQDYYRRNPEKAYCRFVIRPKLKKLGKE